MKTLCKYLFVSSKVELQGQMVFRTNFFVGILMIFLRVFMLLALWNALYIGKDLVNGIDLPTMRFYTVVSVVVEVFISSNIEKNIGEKIKNGDISVLMTRPISYPVAVSLDQLAFTFQNIVIRVLPYTLILLLSGIAFGAQVQVSFSFFLSIFLSYLLMMFYQLFFGFISFWTLEISGILEARDAAMLVFSGSMIPLWFFPDWLFAIARFLPFQALFNTPLSILIGKISGQDIGFYLLVQVGWVLIFFILTVLFWKKAKRRVIVNGG